MTKESEKIERDNDGRSNLYEAAVNLGGTKCEQMPARRRQQRPGEALRELPLWGHTSARPVPTRLYGIPREFQVRQFTSGGSSGAFTPLENEIGTVQHNMLENEPSNYITTPWNTI